MNMVKLARSIKSLQEIYYDSPIETTSYEIACQYQFIAFVVILPLVKPRYKLIAYSYEIVFARIKMDITQNGYHDLGLLMFPKVNFFEEDTRPTISLRDLTTPFLSEPLRSSLLKTPGETLIADTNWRLTL